MLPVLTALLWPVLPRLDAAAVPPPALDDAAADPACSAILPPPALEALARSAERVQLPVRSTVFNQGDPGDRYYVIEEGSVQVTIDGRPIRVQGAVSGFGEIALLHEVPRTATVTTIEPLTAWTLDRARLPRRRHRRPGRAGRGGPPRGVAAVPRPAGVRAAMRRLLLIAALALAFPASAAAATYTVDEHRRRRRGLAAQGDHDRQRHRRAPTTSTSRARPAPSRWRRRCRRHRRRRAARSSTARAAARSPSTPNGNDGLCDPGRRVDGRRPDRHGRGRRRPPLPAAPRWRSTTRCSPTATMGVRVTGRRRASPSPTA